MSVRIMSEVWKLPIPSTEKMVLLCLADFAGDDGKCWPSVATICEMTSKGERTVQAALRWLAESGIVERSMRNGTSPVYTLDPRKYCAPANSAPPQDLPQPPQDLPPTPANIAPKPSRTTNEPPEKKTRAHSLPADWKPEPFTAGTKSREIVDGWPPGQFDETLEAFTAHHRARDNKFKDWQHTWSTWVLRSRDFSNGRKPQQHRANRSSAREIGERIANELASQASAAANW